MDNNSKKNNNAGKRISNILDQSEKKLYEALFEISPDMNYLLDKDGYVVNISASSEKYLKYSREELLSFYFLDLVHEDDIDIAKEVYSKVMEKEASQFEIRLHNRDKEIIHFEVSSIPIFEGEEIIGAFGIARDITAKKEIERKLREDEQRYRSLFDDNVDAVITFDLEGRFTSVNKATEELMGCSADELIGKPFLPFIVPSLQEYTIKEFLKVLEGRSIQYETAMYNREKESVDLHITLIPIIIDDETIGIHCIGKDITVQKRAESALNDMAFNDYLTKLPNLYALNRYLDYLIESEEQFSIFMMDLDRFKTINDSWGHEMGDQLLKAVTQRLANHISVESKLFKYGGDEYVIVLKHKNMDEIYELAQVVKDLFKESFVFNEIEISISSSVGISIYPEDGTNMDTLFKKADNALYFSKIHGRNNVVMFRSIENEHDDKLTRMESYLRNAIKNNELSLVYQPQIDMSSREIDGVEALLRWDNPVLGSVSPYDFIPVAEESGLIIEIGNWVMDSACRQIQEWSKTDLGDLSVSVNISTHQFYHMDFITKIQEVLDDTKIDPRLLVLEITESIASNSDIVIDQLIQLKELGVKVSIDDFGTGYSSLKYLKDFPIDYLKIDKSFVQGIEKSKKDQDLVSTIITLAHNLGFETIAEGPETVKQVQFLIEHRCDYAQGYYYSRPITPENLEIWITNYSIKKKR